MYQQYAEVQQDDMGLARSRERELIRRSISLLEAAASPDASDYAVVESTHFTARVWSALLDDLAKDDNQLPQELRATIISIGIWILREVEAIRKNESKDFEGIVEVSQLILGGME